jgi:hypothetical protein
MSSQAIVESLQGQQIHLLGVDSTHPAVGQPFLTVLFSSPLLDSYPFPSCSNCLTD